MASEAAKVMHEVIPRLWIGDYQAAQDLNLLEEKGVSCVVSAMRQEYDAHDGIELHRVAVDDDDRTNIAEHFERTAEFIEAAMEREQGVLVHCQAGVSRSTTLVAAYLMLKHGMNVEQAVEKIRSARAQVEPSEFFMMQLEMFERCDCEWDPVKWPEERRFLMSFAQTQIMEGASPAIVLAYYPSPAPTPQNAPSLSMTSLPSEQVSPPPSPVRATASAASPSAADENRPPIHPEPLPHLSAPPMRKRLTPRKNVPEKAAEEEEKTKTEIAKIGSKEKVVVTGRRIRCKMCRRELAAREHIVAHEPGKGQQAFAPNRRDMVAFRAEQEKRRAEEMQKAAGITPPAAAAAPSRPAAPAAPSPQPPTNPLAGLRISQPLPGLRVSMPRGAPVARPQPVARPTRPEAAPALTTRDEEIAASTSSTPSSGTDSAASTAPPSAVISAPAAPSDEPSSAPLPSSASASDPNSAPPPSSSSPPPTPVLDPPLLPSPACSSYFVEPLSWMSPILETGVLAGKIVCPNKKCGAKLGGFDWAGNQCSCGAWVCPGFALNVSKVDEVTL